MKHPMRIPELYTKRVVVFGCGNTLFGDDGFGPTVAGYINRNYSLPDDVYVMDAGTGVREILFNMVLYQGGPKKIIVVDAVDKGKAPGEIFEIDLDDIPYNKTDDFSMHQMPSSNMLKDLRDFCGIEVKVLVCQTGHVPAEVETGLSEEVERAVKIVSDRIMEEIMEKNE